MRARVDLVVHEVVELQHVHDPDRDVLLERLAGPAVEQDRLPARGQARQLEQLALDLLLERAVEHRRRHVHAAAQLVGEAGWHP